MDERDARLTPTAITGVLCISSLDRMRWSASGCTFGSRKEISGEANSKSTSASSTFLQDPCGEKKE